MKIFYRDEQSAKKNNSFSPSAGKPALVVESWKRSHPDAQVVSFEPVTRAELYKVHNPKYVDGVLNRRIQNGFGNKLKEVAESLPYVCGSMVAATLHAYRTGETSASPTSGAHHACYSHGGGYCTFNSLVLGAVLAREAGAERVGIIDCDMHGGNGTVDIIDELRLGYIQHYSFGYDRTRENRPVREWLMIFTMNVMDIMRACDVVIYNAGVDNHLDDPLGGVLSTVEMAERDDIVFRAARMVGKPIAWALAGGYQDPVSKVVALHNLAFEAARRWENS